MKNRHYIFRMLFHSEDQNKSYKSQITITWLRKWVGGFGRKMMESEITILGYRIDRNPWKSQLRHSVNKR